MKNEMTIPMTPTDLAIEEIARLSALSDAVLVRWAKSCNFAPYISLDGGPLTEYVRSRLIRHIRLTNKLVEFEGLLIWVDVGDE